MKNRVNFKRHLFLVALMFCSLVPIAFGREINNFDTDWFFFKGDVAGAEKPEFADAGWRRLDVPHDWSIEGPFDKNNPTGPAGGFLPGGTGWYRKHFTARANQAGKKFFIEFDGVMANSDVWINGVHLGRRPYGYVGFGYELTPHLKFGGDDVIVVRADNSRQPASRWYTGAGIYRHVRLVTTDPVHIEKWGAFVSTPQIGKEGATVKIDAAVVNSSDKQVQIAIKIDLRDPRNKVVSSGYTSIQSIQPGKSYNFSKELVVKNPRLWNLEDPEMYRASVSVMKDGNKPVDDETVPFGIRDAHFDAGTGFWLNGKNFKIKGVCLHHDGSAFGAAVPLAVWEYRLNELRKLGVNAIRTAHNPPAPEFLELTDRMGFLVMDETFDQWTVAKNPHARYGAARPQSSERDNLQRRK
jgi:beta-galactosidase